MKSSPEPSTTLSRGYIHSVETFGTVDGPGVRFVIFFQGCPLRCKYCHNPDTWEFGKGETMTVRELLDEYERNRSFYGTRGGLTCTGGEPLMQLPFLISLFEEAKKRGIHTCLDTSGWPYRKERAEEYQRLFRVTDLVLLDIKHSDPKGHLELCSVTQDPVIAFGDALNAAHVKVLIRHVCVPGITDQDEELRGVGKIMARWDNLIGLDVLPYHVMGKVKYSTLGYEYPLGDLRALTKEEAANARSKIILSYHQERQKRLSTQSKGA